MPQSFVPREPAALPSLRTRLIGREQECADGIRFLIDDAVALLTITGPGGVGKTSLALDIARSVKASFADDVIWVDLTPVQVPAHVPTRLASALRIELPAGDVATLAEALADALSYRQCLLLLDNCEQVAVSAAELLARLLPLCPALQVLATSRIPLNNRFEQRLRLDPLPVPPSGLTSVAELSGVPSVQLFLTRSRGVQPHFALDTLNAASIAALCRQLEGLPLAIELAATQVNVFTPEALLETMRSGSAAQISAIVGLPERQQSIAATIDWSYGLLSLKAQALFRRLAIFAGGCTLEAAAAVIGWEPARTAQVLGELVDANLVTQAGHHFESRFDMLESMRSFALVRLHEHREEPAARQAHAVYFTDYFARSFPDILGPNAFPWLRRFDRELENIRVAFTWLLSRQDGLGAMRLLAATDDYWSYNKHRSESRAWAEAALRLAPHAPAAIRSVVLHIATFSTRSLGDFPAAIELAEQGLAAAQESGELVAIGRAYYQLGNAWHHVNLTRSVDAAEHAVRVFRESNDLVWLAVVTADLGDKLRDCGDLESALPILEEGLARNRAIPHPWGVAQALGQIGHAFLAHGEIDQAAQHFAESIPLAQEIGDDHMVMGAVVGLAGIALQRDHPVAAAVLLGAVDAAQQATGWPRVSHPIPATRIRQAVTDALPRDAWESALAGGGMLPFPEAVAAALAIAAHEDDAFERLERHAVTSCSVLSTRATSRGARSIASNAREDPELSWRELEVLALLCQRFTNHEMAQALFVSSRTIESHVSNILSKLRVRNRREAAAVAVKRGLLPFHNSDSGFAENQ